MTTTLIQKETDSLVPENISPEGLQIAETYLMMGSCTKKTALELGLPSTVVHSMLSKKEVKNYIDRIYFETGFRNRDKVASVMDELISRKLEELDESEWAIVRTLQSL